MFRSSRIAACLAILAAVAVPSSLRAQSFNIAAGASVPTGDLGNAASTGFVGIAGIGISPPLSPLGFRVEGMYNQFSIGCGNNTFGCTTDNFSVWAGTANATYSFPLGVSTGPVGPSASVYGIGGIGFYGTHNSQCFGCTDQTNFGWNVGAGVKFALAGFSAYVEARYHAVVNSDNSNSGQGVNFIPIVFGVTF